MSDTGFRSSILADDSGRRRRRLRWIGRVLTIAFLLWLGVLGLGTLGLQPVGGLPVVGLLPERAAPPELPIRVQAAVSRHEVVRLAPPTPAVAPRPETPSGRARPPAARPGNGAARRAARPAPAPPGVGTPAAAALPVRPVAPGQALRPERTRTAPGRQATAPATVAPRPPQSQAPAWIRGRPLDEDLPEPARGRGPR